MAAMLGALPLALSFGDGGELRRPLGISIVGGLIVSQVLTLYTTPVVYLYLDRFRLCGAAALATRVSCPGCRRAGGGGMMHQDRRRAGAGTGGSGLHGRAGLPAPRRAGAARVQGTGRLEAQRSRATRQTAAHGGRSTTTGARQAGAAGRGLQPERVKPSEAAYRNAVGAGAGSAGQPVPDAHPHTRASRAAAATGGRPAWRQQAAAAADIARNTAGKRKLGPRRLGRDPPAGRKPGRGGAGQRGRSGECQAVGAGDAGHRLFRAAGRGLADATAARDAWRRISARCRSRRTSTMPAPPRAPTRDGAGTAAVRPGATGRRRSGSARSTSMRSPC